MSVAKNRGEFEKAAKGLPVFYGWDSEAEIVCIEPPNPDDWRDTRQKAIIRRKNDLYMTHWYGAVAAGRR